MWSSKNKQEQLNIKTRPLKINKSKYIILKLKETTSYYNLIKKIQYVTE